MFIQPLFLHTPYFAGADILHFGVIQVWFTWSKILGFNPWFSCPLDMMNWQLRNCSPSSFCLICQVMIGNLGFCSKGQVIGFETALPYHSIDELLLYVLLFFPSVFFGFELFLFLLSYVCVIELQGLNWFVLKVVLFIPTALEIYFIVSQFYVLFSFFLLDQLVNIWLEGLYLIFFHYLLLIWCRSRLWESSSGSWGNQFVHVIHSFLWEVLFLLFLVCFCFFYCGAITGIYSVSFFFSK